jgi:hypothetical protein
MKRGKNGQPIVKVVKVKKKKERRKKRRNWGYVCN